MIGQRSQPAKNMSEPKTKAPSARAGKDAQLTAELRELHRQSRGTYGRPRLTQALRQRCAAKRVTRLMRSAGLRGVRRGRLRPQTTDSRHEHGVAPNRLQEPAPPAAPDQVWVADITYIPTAEGWLYVAGVLDRCRRRVLGLAMAARLDTALPEAALRQALARRGRPRGLLHHSDRGIQYPSARYRQILQQHSLVASMSRRAIAVHHLPSYSPELNPDERLNRSLKSKLGHLPAARDERSLQRQIIGRLRSCQKQPEHVRSFFTSTSTKYAA